MESSRGRVEPAGRRREDEKQLLTDKLTDSQHHASTPRVSKKNEIKKTFQIYQTFFFFLPKSSDTIKNNLERMTTDSS